MKYVSFTIKVIEEIVLDGEKKNTVNVVNDDDDSNDFVFFPTCIEALAFSLVLSAVADV